MLDGFADARERGGEFLVGNFLAVQADAFVDALEVRRRVQAGALVRNCESAKSTNTTATAKKMLAPYPVRRSVLSSGFTCVSTR